MAKRIGAETGWMVDGRNQDERADSLRADVQVVGADLADTLHGVDQALRFQGVNPVDVAQAAGHVSFEDVLATIDEGLNAAQGEQS